MPSITEFYIKFPTTRRELESRHIFTIPNVYYKVEIINIGLTDIIVGNGFSATPSIIRTIGTTIISALDSVSPTAILNITSASTTSYNEAFMKADVTSYAVSTT